MQVTLTLEVDPVLLAQLLIVCQARGHRLAVSEPSTPDASSIRTLLTSYGLTPRQCDVVLLDVQGYTRTDIATYCGISPESVKKYWNAIYAALRIRGRQAVRSWVLAQLHARDGASLKAQAVGVPNEPPLRDWSSAEPASLLDTRSTAHD
jgi:DNA-binding CsgD family transcriptional regulator